MPKISDIMVCVTNQRSCERLIRRGMELTGDGIELHVVHCVQTGHNFMGTPFEADAIEYLFTAAQVAGAELTMLRADNVDDALVDYAQTNNVGLIVMGASPERNRGSDSIMLRLQRRLPGIMFDIVKQEDR